MGNKTRVAFENKYVFKHDSETKTKDIHIFLTPTSKAYIRHYSLRDSVARDVVIEEIVDLSQENISNLNKMHVLKVKTGYDSDDVLNAILKTINNCEYNHFDLLVDSASINDQIIITNWLESN